MAGKAVDDRSGSSGMTSTGTLDGRLGGFAYLPNHDPPVLEWAAQNCEDGGQLKQTISCRELVCVLLKEKDTAAEILIIHETSDTQKEGTSDHSGVDFQALEAVGLPDAFVETFLLRRLPEHLTILKNEDGTSNIHIIISTGSGTGKAVSFCHRGLQPALAHLGLQEDAYAVHTTQTANTIAELTREIFLPRAQRGIQQSIILLSGDGGVHDLINELLSKPHMNSYIKPVISPLLFGTGNALASSTRDPSSVLSSYGFTQSLRGVPKALPIFKVRFSPGSVLVDSQGKDAGPIDHIYGAVVCSWGFHAALVADSDTPIYRKHGAKRFQMAAQELLFPSDGSPSHHYRGRLTLTKRNEDSESVKVIERREHMYVLATLVSNLEEKFKISPSSRPLDGKLRVLHFGPIGAQAAMDIMTKAYQPEAKHIEDERISYEEISAMRLDMEEVGEANSRWRRICVDGKIVRLPENGSVEVKKHDEYPVDIVYGTHPELSKVQRRGGYEDFLFS